LTGRLGGDSIGVNRTIHRLRGGVKVPTGGRLAIVSQPANRIGPQVESWAAAADLTPGASRGRQGRRSQSGREKATALCADAPVIGRVAR
jgi:hypothetical protein